MNTLDPRQGEGAAAPFNRKDHHGKRACGSPLSLKAPRLMGQELARAYAKWAALSPEERATIRRDELGIEPQADRLSRRSSALLILVLSLVAWSVVGFLAWCFLS